jgi:hypothetical protein
LAISSTGRPSNRRNSMTVRCFCLTSIDTFRFSPFETVGKVSCREIFYSWDSNVSSRDIFACDLSCPRPSAMALI